VPSLRASGYQWETSKAGSAGRMPPFTRCRSPPIQVASCCASGPRNAPAPTRGREAGASAGSRPGLGIAALGVTARAPGVRTARAGDFAPNPRRAESISDRPIRLVGFRSHSCAQNPPRGCGIPRLQTPTVRARAPPYFAGRVADRPVRWSRRVLEIAPGPVRVSAAEEGGDLTRVGVPAPVRVFASGVVRRLCRRDLLAGDLDVLPQQCAQTPACLCAVEGTMALPISSWFRSRRRNDASAPAREFSFASADAGSGGFVPLGGAKRIRRAVRAAANPRHPPGDEAGARDPASGRRTGSRRSCSGPPGSRYRCRRRPGCWSPA
jgi:hypothetical protein